MKCGSRVSLDTELVDKLGVTGNRVVALDLKAYVSVYRYT